MRIQECYRNHLYSKSRAEQEKSMTSKSKQEEACRIIEKETRTN